MTEFIQEAQSAIKALDSTLLGIILTLILGAIGYLIAGSHENRKWKRQQRLEIYLVITKLHASLEAKSTELIRALEKHRLSKRSKLTTETNETEHKVESNNVYLECLAILNELKTQLAICSILGTPKIMTTIDKYLDASIDRFDRVIKSTKSDADEEISSDVEHDQYVAWSTFLYQAQRDLGLRPLWERKKI